MSVFVLRRFLTLVATLVGASVIIFLVLDALPGNAAETLMGADASPDAIRALTVKLGLDQPLLFRYAHWIGGMLAGDLGNSYACGTPVAGLIATVKFSFDRAAAKDSTNKDKALFQSFERVDAPDAETIVIALKNAEPNLPFLLGQATAAIVEPKSAGSDATQPVGTGPYTLGSWSKGSSLALTKWPGYRNAAAIKLAKVTIRFISDPSAQVAALLVR